MPACFVVALYPRAVPAFVGGAGFLFRVSVVARWLYWCCVELFVDRVTVVVTRGGGVL